MEIKQPRFECLSCEFYQGSHTFQQGLPHLSTSLEGFLVGLGRHNPHSLRRIEADLCGSSDYAWDTWKTSEK